MSARGAVAIVLHAHLPWVRHPEHEDFLEERWLFEALTETYLPLLEVLDGLARDAVPTRLTVSLSPTLLGMLGDRLLRARYVRYLDRQVALAEQEERRTRADPALHPNATMYLRRFGRARSGFLDVCRQDVAGAFRGHRDAGVLELATSAATHGLLPLLDASPGVVAAQIAVAATEYRRAFGGQPAGFWLPECAYAPGIDATLARAGFRWFVLETHGLTHASPAPVHGVYAPIACPSGIAAFGRDPDSSRQVWSADDGYPGDPWYRDFHADIGLELDADYLGPYVPSGCRAHTGLKYRRVTGATERKEPYEAARAAERVAVHAQHFVDARREQIRWLAERMDRPPVVVCPYDAELFGHWWFEGPAWLDHVLRRIADTPDLAACTPSDDLERHPVAQVATPAASTWGRDGHHDVWLGATNDWLYPHLHGTAAQLRRLCAATPHADEWTRRALTQALRELLLAQASDWSFLMARQADATYASRRARDSLLRCQRLCTRVEQGAVDPSEVVELEERDNLFPTLDYRVFA